MDEEAFLNLFELHWFIQNPFFTKPTSQSLTSPHQTLFHNQTQQKLTMSRLQTRHVRSLSDDSNSKTNTKSTNPFSPNSVLPLPKLATILSGKVVEEVAEKEQKQDDDKFSQNGEKRRGLPVRTNKLSKSLSELEFEEINGFMDLGFTFSEDQKDPRLVEIIPGLRRLGRAGENIDRTRVSRPYLSESWVNQKPENPLIGLRLSLVSDGVDMKEQLRLWAHTVASSVR